MNPTEAQTPTGLPSDSPVPLESVLCTEELNRRPSRPPDYQTENRALAALAKALADSPRTILQTLADTILEVFQADSAGMSLLTKHDGGKRFYWPAIAGAWKRHVGGGTPRDFGPCGDVLDRNAALLFKHFERRYLYLLPATPPAEEALLVPFHVNGKAVGTIWAMAHDERRRFDAEDLRQLESLGRFASAAYQAAHVPQTDESRRAALNLMEDAVHARQALETLYVELSESKERLASDLAGAQRLQEISSRLISEGDVGKLYDEILDAAMGIMRSDMASMQIVDESEDALRMLASRGFDPAFGQTFELNRPDTKTSSSVARRLGQRVVVPDVQTCDFIAGTTALADHRQTGIRAVQSTPLFSRGGKMLGMISTHWRQPHDPPQQALGKLDILARLTADLIERWRSEEALRRHADQFRTLLYEAPLGVYLVDADFRIRHVNPTTFRVFGDLEVIGRDFDEVIHVLWPTAHADEIVRRFRHTLETGEPYITLESIEERLDRGVTEYYEWQIHRIPLPEGDDGVVCYFRDISAHVVAKLSLRRTLEFDEAVMLGMAEGLYTVDVQGRVTSINPAAEKLFGWQRGELLGCKMHDVTHYRHRDGSPFPADECAGLRVLLDGGVLNDHEDVFIRKDGTFFDVVYSASPLRDGDQTFGAVVVFRDISQRIAMEREIRQQAGQLADESRRKDEFLAMLSHELRNPLAPIRSAVHLLRLQGRGSENRIQQEAREIIERQVGNLTKLVSDLLEVSRVVSGRIRLDLQTVDINEVVRHAAQTIRPLIEQREHELVLNLGEGPVWVNLDATRMEEVLINLLNNAAKYTDVGGRIEVHCELPSGGDSDVRIRVRDNGVGIDNDLLPRIFDLFTQADRSLARSAGGLGIGLSLAQRLVALHGGTLEVHSPPQDRPGEGGSEFIVKLPSAQVPEMPQPAEPATPTAARRDGMRVLVVDDSIDHVTTISNALRHIGCSVQSAYTGLGGLELALQWRPDAVLLDIGLPGIDGYEVAKRLRSDPATKSVRLIALTGYARDTDIAQAREAGFDAHLAKPLDFGQLEKLLTLNPAEETTRG